MEFRLSYCSLCNRAITTTCSMHGTAGLMDIVIDGIDDTISISSDEEDGSGIVSDVQASEAPMLQSLIDIGVNNNLSPLKQEIKAEDEPELLEEDQRFFNSVSTNLKIELASDEKSVTMPTRVALYSESGPNLNYVEPVRSLDVIDSKEWFDDAVNELDKVKSEDKKEVNLSNRINAGPDLIDAEIAGPNWDADDALDDFSDEDLDDAGSFSDEETIGNDAGGYSRMVPKLGSPGFKCPCCEHIYKSKDKFIRHTCRCDITPEQFKGILVTFHKAIKLRCGKCKIDYHSGQKNELILHMKRVHDINLYSCASCDSCFLNILGLIRHGIQKHGHKKSVLMRTIFNRIFQANPCDGPESDQFTNAGLNSATADTYGHFPAASVSNVETSGNKAAGSSRILLKQRNPNDKSGFRCPCCEQVCKTEVKFITHNCKPVINIEKFGGTLVLTGHKSLKLRCGTCKKDYPSRKNEFILHMTQVHDINLYPCDTCDLCFLKINSLCLHSVSKHGIKKADTMKDVFNKIFQPKPVDVHEFEQVTKPGPMWDVADDSIDLPKEDLGDTDSISDIEASRNMTDVSSRMVPKHGNQDENKSGFQCPCCEQVYTTETRFIIHTCRPVINSEKLRGILTRTKKAMTLRCGTCKIDYPLKKNKFIWHMKKVHDINLYPCDTCDSCFVKIDSLCTHSFIKHDIKKADVMRNLFNKIFQPKPGDVPESQKVTKAGPIWDAADVSDENLGDTGSVYDKETSRNVTDGSSRMVLTHGNQDEDKSGFQCPCCEQVFKTEDKFITHVCTKGVISAEQFKGILVTFNRSITLRCEKCKIEYPSRKNEFILHMKRVHGITLFPCNTCDSCFVTINAFYNHAGCKHAISKPDTMKNVFNILFRPKPGQFAESEPVGTRAVGQRSRFVKDYNELLNKRKRRANEGAATSRDSSRNRKQTSYRDSSSDSAPEISSPTSKSKRQIIRPKRFEAADEGSPNFSTANAKNKATYVLDTSANLSSTMQSSYRESSSDSAPDISSPFSKSRRQIIQPKRFEAADEGPSNLSPARASTNVMDTSTNLSSRNRKQTTYRESSSDSAPDISSPISKSKRQIILPKRFQAADNGPPNLSPARATTKATNVMDTLTNSVGLNNHDEIPSLVHEGGANSKNNQGQAFVTLQTESPRSGKCNSTSGVSPTMEDKEKSRNATGEYTTDDEMPSLAYEGAETSEESQKQGFVPLQMETRRCGIRNSSSGVSPYVSMETLEKGRKRMSEGNEISDTKKAKLVKSEISDTKKAKLDKSEENQKEELEEEEEDDDSSEERRKHVCGLCYKEYNELNDLKEHINMHRRERNLETKPLVCGLCRQVFSDLKALKEHMLDHKNKRIRCKVCNDVFNSKYLLKEHDKVHVTDVVMIEETVGIEDAVLSPTKGDGVVLEVEKKVTDKGNVKSEDAVLSPKEVDGIVLEGEKKVTDMGKFKSEDAVLSSKKGDVVVLEGEKNVTDKGNVKSEDDVLSPKEVDGIVLEGEKKVTDMGNFKSEDAVLSSKKGDGVVLEVEKNVTDKGNFKSEDAGLLPKNGGGVVLEVDKKVTAKGHVKIEDAVLSPKAGDWVVLEGEKMVTDKGHLDTEETTPEKEKKSLKRKRGKPKKENKKNQLGYKKEVEFTCQICNKTFKNESVMKFHISGHSMDALFDDDAAIDDNEDDVQDDDATEDVYEDQENEDVNKKYSCYMCSERFADRFALKSHMRAHMLGDTESKWTIKIVENVNKVQQFNCEKCTRMFPSQDTLDVHFAAFHERRFKCKTCLEIFDTISALMKHRQIHKGDRHLGQRVTKGIIKRERAKRIKVLKEKKVKVKKERIVREKMTGQYKCEKCEKRFTTILRRTIHKCIETRIRCRFCDVVFSSKDIFNDHKITCMMSFKLNDYKFSCIYCGIKFKDENVSIKHQSKGGSCNVKPMPCKKCGTVFPLRIDFYAHIQEVHKMQVWRCDVCNKPFDSLSNKLRHQITHTNLKPFKCDDCGLRFHLKEGVQRHMAHIHKRKPSEAALAGSFAAYDANDAAKSEGKSISTKKSPKKAILEEVLAQNECKKPSYYKLKIMKKIGVKGKKTKKEDGDLIKNEKGVRGKKTKKENGDPNMKCGKCKQKFTSDDELQTHSCNKKCVSKANKNTEPRKRRQRPFKNKVVCARCELDFGTENMAYAEHMKIEHYFDVFPCRICPAVYDLKTSLWGHVKITHGLKLSEVRNMSEAEVKAIRYPETVSDTNPNECDKCKIIARNKYALIVHKRKIHSQNGTKFVCHLCKNEFEHKVSYASHFEKKHRLFKLSCNQCPRTFTKRCYLMLHLGSHAVPSITPILIEEYSEDVKAICEEILSGLIDCASNGGLISRGNNTRTSLSFHDANPKECPNIPMKTEDTNSCRNPTDHELSSEKCSDTGVKECFDVSVVPENTDYVRSDNVDAFGAARSETPEVSGSPGSKNLEALTYADFLRLVTSASTADSCNHEVSEATRCSDNVSAPVAASSENPAADSDNLVASAPTDCIALKSSAAISDTVDVSGSARSENPEVSAHAGSKTFEVSEAARSSDNVSVPVAASSENPAAGSDNLEAAAHTDFNALESSIATTAVSCCREASEAGNSNYLKASASAIFDDVDASGTARSENPVVSAHAGSESPEVSSHAGSDYQVSAVSAPVATSSENPAASSDNLKASAHTDFNALETSTATAVSCFREASEAANSNDVASEAAISDNVNAFGTASSDTPEVSAHAGSDNQGSETKSNNLEASALVDSNSSEISASASSDNADASIARAASSTNPNVTATAGSVP